MDEESRFLIEKEFARKDEREKRRARSQGGYSRCTEIPTVPYCRREMKGGPVGESLVGVMVQKSSNR